MKLAAQIIPALLLSLFIGAGALSAQEEKNEDAWQLGESQAIARAVAPPRQGYSSKEPAHRHGKTYDRGGFCVRMTV